MSNESVIGTTIPITPAEALNKSPAPAAEETAEQPAGEKEKVNLSSRPLVMSTACSRLEPCAPSAA